MRFHDEELLRRDSLHDLVLSLNPPMPKQSEKAKEIFLKMFTLDDAKKGKILALETRVQERAFIVLMGKVMIYKKLYKMTSNDCEARDKE